jgi:RNA polymerase sigma-70 factor (sigma-E family)
VDPSDTRPAPSALRPAPSARRPAPDAKHATETATEAATETGTVAGTGTGTAQQVTALYQVHALSLVRLAVVMLGDAGRAEDMVQDAFLGLYRRWDSLSDTTRALAYLRSSVLNGCRTVLRQRVRHDRMALHDRISPAEPDTESAEAMALIGEEQREVLRAVRRLPDRQREAVVLRYYLEMTEEQAADAMGVSRGTVKSATSRGIAALGRMLKEGT